MTTQAEFQHLPLEQLVLSQTSTQIERRAHFDKAALQDLANSLATKGMLQPIVARPIINPDAPKLKTFEIVAGERRFLAAELADFDAVPVNVRQLTDDQVLEIQLIENLQREGLHELAEAEGYESLQAQGLKAEEIGEKVGRSKAYVYARLKLAALCKQARSAFYGGKLNASTALLIARLPSENDQVKALAAIAELHPYTQQPMTYREAADWIQKNFMLELHRAPFPTKDANLVPGAGPCAACPKRSGNAQDLFQDVEDADVCTDPPCFQAKTVAFKAREKATAENTGLDLITGAAAKRVKSRYSSSLQDGFVRATEKIESDSKERTYAKVLKDIAASMLQDPETGKFFKVYDLKADVAIDALKAAGISATKKKGLQVADAGSKRDQAQQQAERDEKNRRDEEYRKRIFRAIHKAADEFGDYEYHAQAILDFIDNVIGSVDAYETLGIDLKKFKKENPDNTDIVLLAHMLILAEDLSSYNDGTDLEVAAKRFKVDAKTIRKAVDQEAAAAAQQEQPAKTSTKKKAAKK